MPLKKPSQTNNKNFILRMVFAKSPFPSLLLLVIFLLSSIVPFATILYWKFMLFEDM